MNRLNERNLGTVPDNLSNDINNITASTQGKKGVIRNNTEILGNVPQEHRS